MSYIIAYLAKYLLFAFPNERRDFSMQKGHMWIIIKSIFILINFEASKPQTQSLLLAVF